MIDEKGFKIPLLKRSRNYEIYPVNICDFDFDGIVDISNLYRAALALVQIQSIS